MKYQRERSQALNRYLARKLLVNKIETLVLGELSKERQRIEKLRRQMRRRSRKAKLKILETKRRQAQKKALRAPVRNLPCALIAAVVYFLASSNLAAFTLAPVPAAQDLGGEHSELDYSLIAGITLLWN